MEEDRKPFDLTPEEEAVEYPWIVRLPLQIASDLFWTGFRFIRPYAPQLIPLIVFILTIPTLLFFSISSGWFVWRNIAVGWEVPVYLQYGDGISPYAHTSLLALNAQQPYDISLLLTVPVSESNLNLGNFMASLTLTTLSKRTIASSRRSALVLPPSMPRLSSLWNTPGMVVLHIPLLTNIETGTTAAIARVELGRQDQWKTLGSGEGRELVVSSAVLRGMVVHRGLRGLFTRFPLITALTAAATFFSISFIILASCVLPAVDWQVQGEPKPSEQSVEDTRPRRKQRKREEITPSPSRRRAGIPEQRPDIISAGPSSEIIKTEEVPTALDDIPLRRRRSHLSHPSDSDS